VAAPIASARTLDQLEALIGAMELELNPDQLARLDAASKA
jgi:aryl-alcohol dehydrogenase-like predicted oxidoreductase